MSLLDLLVQRVEGCVGPRVLVAVDGPDAAGKTTLAGACRARAAARRWAPEGAAA